MAGSFLRPGDIILSVNGTTIDSVATLRKATDRSDRQWRIQLRRGGQTVTLSLRG
jgi:S1-C subfamily serine protease